MNSDDRVNTFPGEKEVQELLVQLFQPAVNKVGAEIAGSIGTLKKPLDNISDGVAGIEDLVKLDNFEDKVSELKRVISDLKNIVSTQISEGIKNNTDSSQQTREKLILHIDDLFQRFKVQHEASLSTLHRDNVAIKDVIITQMSECIKNNTNSSQQNSEKVISHTDEVFQCFTVQHEASLSALNQEIISIKDSISSRFENLANENHGAELKNESAFRTIKTTLIILALLQAVIVTILFVK